MLVEDSFADVVILGEETTQRRNWPNGEVGLHLNRLLPQFHMLRLLIFYSDAIFNGQNRELVVAELTRDERTQLIELFRF
jgi:hypothetical protein